MALEDAPAALGQQVRTSHLSILANRDAPKSRGAAI